MKCNIDIKTREVAFAMRSKNSITSELNHKRHFKKRITSTRHFNKLFNNLISGPDIRQAKSTSNVRRVISISEDAIFTVKPVLLWMVQCSLNNYVQMWIG